MASEESRVREAARALALAWHERKRLVEQPIRDALEAIDYGFAAFTSECEGRGLTVTLNGEGGSWHIMVWRKPPQTPKRDSIDVAPQAVDPRDPLASWIDSSYSFTVDHLARCLRAEMAAMGTMPGGWERQRLQAALAERGPAHPAPTGEEL